MNTLTGNKAVLLLFRSIDINTLTGNAQNKVARCINIIDKPLASVAQIEERKMQGTIYKIQVETRLLVH
jgi:hypothetical protein